MKETVILIEDDQELADNTKYLLETAGYKVKCIVNSFDNIDDVLYETSPDVILLDIYLKGNSDGIKIAHQIRNRHHVPIVFFTSLSDRDTINKVKDISPEGYIVKPFTKNTLITTTTLAISNFKIKIQEKVTELFNQEKFINGAIFIRDKGYLKKIAIDQIEWIKADGSYTHISTVNKNVFTLRNILKDVLNKLPPQLFCKVNKSHVINLDKIDALNSKEIIINDQVIPVGRAYYQSILSKLNQVTR